MTPEQRAKIKDGLQAIAKHFVQLTRTRPDATMGYELLSGSVQWSDEIPNTSDDVSMIRLVLRHRTLTMLGQPSEYAEVWEWAQSMFPQWVGFARERCHPSDEVMSSVRKMVKAGKHEIGGRCPENRLPDKRA